MFINDEINKFFDYTEKELKREFESLTSRLSRKDAKFSEERKFTVNINGVETNILFRFDDKGYPVYWTHESKYIPSKEEEELNALILQKEKEIEELKRKKNQ